MIRGGIVLAIVLVFGALRLGSVGIHGHKAGQAMLALHHIDMHKLHLVGCAFFSKGNPHTGGVGEAFEVVDFHGNTREM